MSTRAAISRAPSGAITTARTILREVAPASIEAPDGSSASVEDGAIRVRDGRGRLVFEHLPAEGKSVVHVPDGDLELSAKGKVRIAAGDAIELRAPVLDIVAGRVIERARETYREVAELAQHSAGRLRFAASETLHLLGRRAVLKADEDVKLKGKKVYLG